MFDSWWHHFLKQSECSAVGSALRSGAFWNTASYPLLFLGCRDVTGTAGLKSINLLYHEEQILHFDGNSTLFAVFQLHKDSSGSF